MDENKDFSYKQKTEILLGFFSRQKVNVNTEEWKLTLKCLYEFELSVTDSLFFKMLPVWKKLENLTKNFFDKEIENLSRYQSRGMGFWLGSLDNQNTYGWLNLKDPPRVLCYYGKLESLNLYQRLSIVGSRQAHPETLSWLDKELTLLLTKKKFIIVSGGARGIDQQAHIVAIKTGSPTALLLPSGLFQLYPLEVQNYLKSVLETQGLLMSEYHPEEPMKKWYFQARNRLIAGMSPLVWIPQFRVRSGSWLTAQLALDQGGTVATAPASPWETQFSGNLEYLSQGAACIFSHQDILDYYA